MNDPISESDLGTSPQVTDTLKPEDGTKYAINSLSQARAVAKKVSQEWRDGVKILKVITAQLNGQRPRDPAKLTALGKSWIPNINTGWLASEVGKVPARLWMPFQKATLLTAAHLKSSRPMWAFKTDVFRQEITNAIRSWRKWPFFVRLLAAEVSKFGFGFAVWLDEWDWKPKFVRQDRGFIPFGVEILDETLPVFVVQWDYKPYELLKLAQRSQKAKGGGWNAKAVARAVNAASSKPVSGVDDERRFEELIREANFGAHCEKEFKVISTYHLFSTDADGSVSHHVILKDQTMEKNTAGEDVVIKDSPGEAFLFEKRKQFETLDEVVVPVMFDPDEGTIHGSWGAGQMLLSMSVEVEKAMNDWLMALAQASKIKSQASAGKTPEEVSLVVDDQMMTLANGVYAGNTAAVISDPAPFRAVVDGLGQAARERIGSMIPPIPLQPTDIKAAQIRAKQNEQDEVKQQAFESWLWQMALVIEQMARRLCKKNNPDATAKRVRDALLDKIDEDELEELTHQNQITTIHEFTQEAAIRRAAFAASKAGNPFYNQKRLEQLQAVAAGGLDFAELVLLPGEDETVERMARRQQQMETAVMMATGEIVDVLPMDADWFHMLQLRPKLEEAIMSGAAPEVAGIMLKHYETHWVGAVAKKGMPKDRINVEKSFIAKANDALATGRIPPDGFQDKPDPVEEAQMLMATNERVTRTPTVENEAVEMAEV